MHRPTGTREVVVDNPAAATTGTWTSNTFTGGGIFLGSNYIYDNVGGGTVTWTPSLPAAGRWRVYARWVSWSTYTTAATYTVHHAGGSSAVVVDQWYNGGQWRSLGEYDLVPAQNHRVVLSGGLPGAAAIADAVRFVRVPGVRTVLADAVKVVPNTAEDALYVHADHLGSPRKLSDPSGAVVWDAAFTLGASGPPYTSGRLWRSG